MLILQHLHLQNFMSVDELDLDFDSETTIAISGQNGAGKSTLLYAIAYLLTGYRKGESYRDYVKAGNDTAFLSLTALLKGEPLYCEAELAGNQKKGITQPTKRKTVYKGITYLNSDHNQFIKENELEYTESLIFFFQDSNKDIIDARPSERSAMLKKIFKFEFPEIVNKLKEKQEQNKISNIEASATARELQSRQFTTQPLLREIVPAAITQWQDRIREINRNLIQIGEVDASIVKKIEGDLIAVQTTINETQRKINERTNQVDTWEKNIQKCEDFLKQTSKQTLLETIDQKKEQLEKHKIEYQEAKKQVEEIIKQQNIHTFEQKEIDKQISISETGVCHACGQTVGHEHVEKLKAQKEEVEALLAKLKESLLILNFDSTDNLSKQIESEIKYYEDQIRKYEAEERNLTSYRDRKKESEDMIRDQEEYLSRLKLQKESLLEEKEKYRVLEPLIQQKDLLLKESDELQQKVNKAKEDAIKNKERRATNEIILKEKNDRDAKLTELNNKINDILLSMTTTKTSIDIFESQFPSFLVLQATQMLEECINDAVQKVFPYMRVKLVMQRAGVTFLYTAESSEEEWLPVSMASGAQKTVLCLAYKTSLARLYGISCIMLDEVDASCSDENAEIIYKFVASLDCFQQLIFISHRPESFAAAKEVNPNVITYIVDKGEYSLSEN